MTHSPPNALLSRQEEIDLKNPEYYNNRELSLVAFHHRVLMQAFDESLPLLERMRFVCIASSNLDEFFEVRVAGLKQQAAFGSVQTGPDNLLPHEVLSRISAFTHNMVEQQYTLLNEVLLPKLDQEGIRFLRRSQWSDKQAAWVNRFFDEELAPVLSPVGLDPAHPFPRILNKSLNFIVTLEGRDAFGREIGMAVVQAPRSLPRLIRLPEEISSSPHEFVFLSSILHAYVAQMFPGMNVTGCHQFRVTRNSDLFVDEEEVDDLKRALEGELPARRYGDAVRLEVADTCPEPIVKFLLDEFNLGREDLYQVNGPVNLTRLIALPDLVDRPDLTFPGFTPGLPPSLRGVSMFEAIRQGDILLHHPYQSFTPIVDLLKEAARDPNVIAIKQTLYRTGPDSVLVDALVNAARAGKEVTVVVELRARFDEAANISLADRLHEAGAHVVYGVVGYKTHAKLLMIVRREQGKLRRYIHMGTGNYHARTARIYTDYGLLTCDKEMGEDVHKIFLQLTSLGRGPQLKKVLQAPFTLHSGMMDRIAREAEHAREGKPARIIAKMNSLVEPKIIRALYAASQAGVKIDLIIRGICCLRPGIPGVSENIQVRSIVGRFLEHTRVFCFHNDGKPEVFCSSADWMNRNMFKRVEECFPLERKRLRDQVIADLELALSDNCQAWVLEADGSYRRLHPEGDEVAVSMQATLLEQLAEKVGKR